MTTTARRHLLILNQYYGPSESTGRLLQELAEDLASDTDVTVVAARPTSDAVTPPPIAGVTTRWVPATSFEKGSIALRLLNYLTFLVGSLPQLLRGRRPDAILCMTNPPFIGLAGAFAARVRRSKLVITVQDMHPDVGIVSGRLTNPPAVWALRMVQRYFFRRADRLVAISEGMKQCLVERGAPPGKVEIVHNWVDVDEITPHPRDNAWGRDHGFAEGFVLMHAGNVGLLQALETLVDAAPLAPSDAEVVIVGGGAGREPLERQAERIGAPIQFVPRQPREELNLVLASSDAHLVSLMPGLAGLMEPSKVYGVLAAGRAVLAAMEPGTEAARIVEEAGCGVVVAPGNPKALADGIAELAAMSRDELAAMGAAGRHYAENHCIRSLATDGYREVLASLDPPAP